MINTDDVVAALDAVAARTHLDVRQQLAARKYDTLCEHRQKLRALEARALAMVGRVDYTRFTPTMRPCSPRDSHLWNYYRHVISSAPGYAMVGRQQRFFVFDARSGGVLGITSLNSDLNALGPRDRHIGWDRERKFHNGLNYIAAMHTCVGVAPFGRLTGGKYMTTAILSDEVRRWWQARYCDPMLAASTTSLFGKSSQYNRLREWAYLGLTPGMGVAAITSAERRVLRRYLAQQFDSVAVQGSMHRAGAFEQLEKVSGAVGYDMQKLMSNAPKGVYFAAVHADSLAALRGDIDASRVDSTPTRSLADVGEWWWDRWGSMRFGKFKDEVVEWDTNIYRVDAAIHRAEEAIAKSCVASDTSDTPTVQVGEAGATPSAALHLAP